MLSLSPTFVVVVVPHCHWLEKCRCKKQKRMDDGGVRQTRCFGGRAAMDKITITKMIRDVFTRKRLNAWRLRSTKLKIVTIKVVSMPKIISSAPSRLIEEKLITDNVSKNDKKTLVDAISKTTSWLDSNQTTESEK